MDPTMNKNALLDKAVPFPRPGIAFQSRLRPRDNLEIASEATLKTL
jgi:hypothetical protein